MRLQSTLSRAARRQLFYNDELHNPQKAKGKQTEAVWGRFLASSSFSLFPPDLSIIFSSQREEKRRIHLDEHSIICNKRHETFHHGSSWHCRELLSQQLQVPVFESRYFHSTWHSRCSTLLSSLWSSHSHMSAALNLIARLNGSRMVRNFFKSNRKKRSLNLRRRVDFFVLTCRPHVLMNMSRFLSWEKIFKRVCRAKQTSSSSFCQSSFALATLWRLRWGRNLMSLIWWKFNYFTQLFINVQTSSSSSRERRQRSKTRKAWRAPKINGIC